MEVEILTVAGLTVIKWTIFSDPMTNRKIAQGAIAVVAAHATVMDGGIYRINQGGSWIRMTAAALGIQFHKSAALMLGQRI